MPKKIPRPRRRSMRDLKCDLEVHAVYFDSKRELITNTLRLAEERSRLFMVAIRSLLRLHDAGVISAEQLAGELADINTTVEFARDLTVPRLTPEQQLALFEAVRHNATLLAPRVPMGDKK